MEGGGSHSPAGRSIRIVNSLSPSSPPANSLFSPPSPDRPSLGSGGRYQEHVGQIEAMEKLIEELQAALLDAQASLEIKNSEAFWMKNALGNAVSLLPPERQVGMPTSTRVLPLRPSSRAAFLSYRGGPRDGGCDDG